MELYRTLGVEEFSTVPLSPPTLQELAPYLNAERKWTAEAVQALLALRKEISRRNAPPIYKGMRGSKKTLKHFDSDHSLDPKVLGELCLKTGVNDCECSDVEKGVNTGKLSDFKSTNAIPGTDQKLRVIAERVRKGIPLWHKDDQIGYGDDK